MNLDRPEAQHPYQKLPEVGSFELTSSDLVDGAPIDGRHASPGAHDDAENTSPQLSWSGFPEATKSFVVTCYDPDAPTPSGFWHWAAVDLPVGTSSLEGGAGAGDASLPGDAFHVRNDTNGKQYDGPYPQDGDRPHRYFFVVHAVDVDSLGVDGEASPAVVSFNLVFHTLARAQLVGTFQR